MKKDDFSLGISTILASMRERNMSSVKNTLVDKYSKQFPKHPDDQIIKIYAKENEDD